MNNKKKWLFYFALASMTLFFPAVAFPQPTSQAKYLIRAGYTNPVVHPVTETGYLFQELVQYRSITTTLSIMNHHI